MTPQSKKSKGRNLQKFVCEELLKIGQAFGLESGDIRSCSMGANGLDIILSPAARRVFGLLAIECKNQENLNVITTFFDHVEKYPAYIPLLVHKKNFTAPLVTMKFSDYFNLLKLSLLPKWEELSA